MECKRKQPETVEDGQLSCLGPASADLCSDVPKLGLQLELQPCKASVNLAN